MALPFENTGQQKLPYGSKKDEYGFGGNFGGNTGGTGGTTIPTIPNDPTGQVGGQTGATDFSNFLMEVPDWLKGLSEEGYGQQQLRSMFQLGGTQIGEQTAQASRQLSASPFLQGASGSGFATDRIRNLELDKSKALKKLDIGIESDNEAIKRSSLNQLKDIEMFNKQVERDFANMDAMKQLAADQRKFQLEAAQKQQDAQQGNLGASIGGSLLGAAGGKLGSGLFDKLTGGGAEEVVGEGAKAAGGLGLGTIGTVGLIGAGTYGAYRLLTDVIGPKFGIEKTTHLKGGDWSKLPRKSQEQMENQFRSTKDPATGFMLQYLKGSVQEGTTFDQWFAEKNANPNDPYWTWKP